MRNRWHYLSKHPGLSLILGACAIIVISHGDFSNAPPFPINRTAIIKYLAQTPYDNYRADGQLTFLNYCESGARDSLYHAISAHPYDASVFFHAFLDRSLFLRFIGKPDSAQMYERVAGEIAQHFAVQRGDSFFVRRFEHLTRLGKPGAKELERWIAARTAFMRGIEYDATTTGIQFNLRCLEYSRAQFQQLGDLKHTSDNLWWLYSYYLRIVDHKHELHNFVEQWLRVSHDIGYRDNELEALLIMAEIHSSLRQTDSANVCIEKAVRLAKEIEKPYAFANLWDVKLSDALSRNDIRAALSFLADQFHLIQKIHYRALKAETHAKAAQIYHVLADYNRTLAHLDTAITLKHSLAQLPDLPALLLRQAKVYLELGDWQQALAHADSALHGYAALQNASNTASTLGLIGIIHLRRKDFRQARRYQRQGLAVLESHDANIVQTELWNNLGDIARQDSSWHEAEQAYSNTLTWGDDLQSKPAKARAWLGLGYVSLHHEKSDSALVRFQRAFDLAKEGFMRDLIWNCHFGLAQAYENAGEVAAAKLHHEDTMAELENTRNSVSRLDFNMNYFSTVQTVFDCALRFALETARDTLSALQYMEKAKARNTVDLLYRQIANASHAPEAQDSHRDSLFSRLNANPSNLQTLIDDSTAVVAYRVTPSKLIIAVLRRSQVGVIQTSLTGHALRQKIQKFRRTLGVDDRNVFRKRLDHDRQALLADTERESAEIYQDIIAPVAHLLEKVRTIYLVPDDVLYYLPFVALKDAPGNCLVLEKFNLAFAPSLTALQLMLQRSTPFDYQAECPALMIAMNSKSIPHAVTEVETIAHFFKNAVPKIYTQLTRAELAGMLDHFQGIVHLALHAEVDDSQPLHSFLVLNEQQRNRKDMALVNEAARPPASRGSRFYADISRDNEGVLRATDILDLDFQGHQLVVLSACNTALGQNLSGEGMMGLTQAFLCAGTRRLLTSLWEVDDRSTSELMSRFYRHLQAGTTPAHALRAAQLEMIEKAKSLPSTPYAFPYFWAAFILTGRSD